MSTPVEEKDKIIKDWETCRTGRGYGWLWALLGLGFSVFMAHGSSPVAKIFWLVVAGILLIGSICALVFFIKNVYLYKRLKDLPEVLEYEKERKIREEKLEIERKEREKKERDEKIARYRSFEEENARHVLVVCAQAHSSGKYDPYVHCRVYVDGNPYGDATPWAVLGLPGGTHSVFVQYRESVGGNIYQGNTATEVINADEKSKIFVCDKDGTTIYSPTVYNIDKLGEVVLDLQSHEIPPLAH